MWGTGYGGGNQTSGDAVIGSHALSARTAGFATGFDYRLAPNSVVVFGLAATAVYGVYTGYVEPWEQRLEVAGFGGSRSSASCTAYHTGGWNGSGESRRTLLTYSEILTDNTHRYYLR